MAQIVMLIDDNKNRMAETEAHIQQELGLETCRAATGEAALHYLVGNKLAQPDVVLFCVGKDPFALQAIRTIRSYRNDVQVIAVLSHAQVQLAAEALAFGAADFLLMPFHPVQLTAAIRNVLLRRDLQLEARHAWASQRIALEDIDAKSPPLEATLFLARKLAADDTPLVLEGAPGTGREMLARAIHGSSERHAEPFRAINASLLLPGDAMRQLFGDASHKGMLQQAGRGTLFIRNVDSLSDAVRERLLRVAKGAPVGRGNERFAGRLIFAMYDAARRSASNERREVSDFFSAIGAVPISLPYLREIPDDIPTLAMLHCRRYAALEGRPVTGISPQALQMLREISWPGNMEQLSQGIFNAVMCCQGAELQVEDFRYLFKPQAAKVRYLPGGLSRADGGGKRTQRSDGLLRCVDETGNIKRLQDVEEEVIRYALERYSGHMSDVARHLGIGRSTLYRKISSMDGK